MTLPRSPSSEGGFVERVTRLGEGGASGSGLGGGGASGSGLGGGGASGSGLRLMAGNVTSSSSLLPNCIQERERGMRERECVCFGNCLLIPYSPYCTVYMQRKGFVVVERGGGGDETVCL